MKFNQFFILSTSYIDYLIKHNIIRSFFLEYKDKYEVIITVNVKELD